MTQEKKLIPVNAKLVLHYISTLCRSVARFVKERKRIEEEDEYTDQCDERDLREGGFSVATVNRMLKSRKATPSVAYDVLFTLEILTKEAYKTKPDKFSPENFPVLLNLHIIPDELVPALGPKRGQRTQSESKQNDVALSESSASSRFDLIRELGETIINSKTPQILYATIMDGSVLKCLMDGLDGAGRACIEKIVVRGWDYCPDSNDFEKQALYMYDIIERRIQLLKEISEGEGLNIQLNIDYYNLRDKPTFYALMYGKDAIYSGHCGIRENIYKEVGLPMYKITGIAGEIYLERRNMMMYGEKIAPKSYEDMQLPFDKFPTTSYPYARLTAFISQDLLFSREHFIKKRLPPRKTSGREPYT